MINTSKSVLFLIVMLLFIISPLLPLACADQTEATMAIVSAKDQILTCYQAAKNAEEAGANITVLVAVLNDAGTLFSLAEFAYSINDFDTALDLAVQSKNSLNIFISEASALEETAIQQRNQDFLINVIGSIVGAFAVLGTGVGIWLFLKKKMQNMEPT